MSFKGYAIEDPKKWTDFKVIDFHSKKMEDYDVEIKISYCGVCGSDIHTITGGWGEIITPLITGHEIVGKVTAVGPKVKEFKVGDRAGVGAQVWSCMDCNRCKNNNENYCKKMVDTYNAKYPHTGEIAHGGYSSGIRAHQQFVFKIPEGLEDKYAAPMLCGGLTVFSPLKRHGAAPGKKVGVIGLGGLGHFAVLFAVSYFKCDVTVFSHSDNKKEDAKKMGAQHFVNTSHENWVKEAGEDFDVIISTRDVAEGFPLADFLSILNVHGTLNMVGLPDKELPGMMAQGFVSNAANLSGSHIGSKEEVIEMLQGAADNGIKSWIEELPMSQASKAVQGVKDNKVRYRYVLKQDLE
ncbi:NADPH-dependent alcohol dehydrogenase [Cystobasidium minutum MCA 4210]|uniref:NADPH-dependent alcohol dehydrogenase n=1 Tax=Cystobasidium minutum MCA 4210 TaxID=1397322 RepID=UPI0034CD2B10|eukprot:jgi/Rhomi1/174770/fgenesh1_kg.8_\